MTAPAPAPDQVADPFGLTKPGPLPPPSYVNEPQAEYAAAAPPEPPREAAAAALAQQDRRTVAARGVDITLRDGRVVDVRYGMAGVVALEETFGSLKGVAEAFAALANEDGAAFTAILGLIGAGLTHHGITRADIMRNDLLELTRLMEYADAAGEAFDRAFPAPAKSAGEAAGQATP